MRPIFFWKPPIHIHPEIPVKINKIRFRQSILAALMENPGNTAALFFNDLHVSKGAGKDTVSRLGMVFLQSSQISFKL